MKPIPPDLHDETEDNNELSQAISDSDRDETNRNEYEENNETGIFRHNYCDF